MKKIIVTLLVAILGAVIGAAIYGYFAKSKRDN